MTYKEIKDRLTKCEFTLQSIKNGTFKSPKGKKLVQSQKKLELLKESLTKQLKEAEKTAFINDKPVEYEKEKDLKKFKDNLDVDSITTIDGKEIKEDVKFSLDETKAIAKKVGQAVAKALKASGDDIAHMKAVAIVENSFGINVEYKNGKSDVMSFYVAEGKLIFPTDKESITLVDIGVQPSGEPIIQVDVLANELIKHFKTMHESSFYESDSDKIDAVLKTASDQMNLTEDEIKDEVYKSLTDKGHGRSPVVEAILRQLFKFTEPKIIIAHLEGKQSDALAAEQTEVNEVYQTTYIKVAIADYKKAMAILDNNIDPTYAKMDVVDDDGDGNVIIYFNFRAKDDGEPGEDVAAFIYDAAMDLSSQGIKVVDASHDDIDEVTEQEDQEKDDIDIGHIDDEPSMLSASARETAEYAAKILKKLQTYDKHDGEVDFPNWWQSKLILARDYMSSAFHYLDSEEKQPALDQLALEGVKEVNEDQDKMMQAQWEDLSQVVKNIAHVGEMDIKDAAMESVFYIGDEFGVDGMIREYKDAPSVKDLIKKNDNRIDALAKAISSKFDIKDDGHLRGTIRYALADYLFESCKVGDILTKDGKKGKVIKHSETQATVDFGNGDVYGIAHSRIKDGKILKEEEYHETDSYADYEDIAQAYMEAHQYRRRMLRMSNKQLETLGKKIVDQKYDGDVGKAYDEIVLSDYKPVKKKKPMYSDKVDENISPEVHRIVNGLVKKMADRYDYSLQDAVYAIIRVLKSQNYSGFANEAKVGNKINIARAKSHFKQGEKIAAINKKTGKVIKITGANQFGGLSTKEYDFAYLNEGTFNTDNHVATFGGDDGYAEVYKQADGSFYIVVGGDIDYDMTATDTKDAAAKLKRDGYTKLQSGELNEGRGDMDMIMQIVQDRANEDGVDVREAAVEIVMGLAHEYNLPVDKNLEDYMQEDNNPVPDVPADDMQFMHGQVVTKMKNLAKIYKEKGPEATVMLGPNNDREEKVVDVLKLLTRKKRELEDALDKKVSGIGTGQELDPSIEEETKN